MRLINVFQLCSAILLSLCSKATETAKAKNDRPNIILIMSDDMGYSDIGCYGSEIATPNLDKLAKDGLRFTQFYNEARCCPTRASLLTGVYQHQAGIGLMVADKKLPGYRGDLGNNVVTIAEVLKQGGYRTYMTGKWHVTQHAEPDGPKFNWPLQRGFEKFYGTIAGAGNYFDPTALCRDNQFITPLTDSIYHPNQYYYTTALSDNAVMFLDAHQKESPNKPFFLYVAYTAAHWPLHALPEDIQKYTGKYDSGFETIRGERMRRMIEMGIIAPEWELSPQPKSWGNTPNKDWEARNMEVYAAMIDCMDQGIGKIVAELEKQGQLENTIIMYLQDNGGCAESYGRNTPKDPYPTDLKPITPDEFQTRTTPPMQTRDGRPVKHGPEIMAGADDTFIAYGQSWANVSNTPFREYKHFVHEGGISTPFIVSWPNGINKNLNGHLCHVPAHLIDVMATCVDVSSVQYLQKKEEQDILPMEGISLAPSFQGAIPERKDAIYFEHQLNSAIREGEWKLVRKGVTQIGEFSPWELYHMTEDRTETKNLSGEYPEKVKELGEKWNAWAIRALVFPSPYEKTNKKQL